MSRKIKDFSTAPADRKNYDKISFWGYAYPMTTPKRRFFNTTGPCRPDMHYMLPPAERLVGAQMAIPEPEWKWEKPDGALDMDALLREFQVFWRNNSEIWMEEGIRQTRGYRDRFSGTKAGAGPIRCYLVIFDRRPDKPSWEERLRWIPGEEITVAGC
jgi:hypothetical protein